MLVNKSTEASHSHSLWLIDMQMSWSRGSLISLYERRCWPFPVPASVTANNNRAVAWQRGTMAQTTSFRLHRRVDHREIHCTPVVPWLLCCGVIKVIWKITEISVGELPLKPKTCSLLQRGAAEASEWEKQVHGRQVAGLILRTSWKKRGLEKSIIRFS